MNYVHNAQNLHKYGSSAKVHRLLSTAVSLKSRPQKDLVALAAPRRHVVQLVSKMARSGNFRKQVLQAYDHRCAISKAQLRLVDAAHILPVGAPGSTDDVRNGIALAPTYYRAFDNGLIYLNEKHIIRLNRQKASELAALNLDDGLSDFRGSLGKILLPPDQRQWPHYSFIRKGNRFRDISARA